MMEGPYSRKMNSKPHREDAVQRLCQHVLTCGASDIPAPARAAGRTFLLDSLGVGIAGSRGPFVRALLDAHGGCEEARVLGHHQALPAGGAALLNAYQIHNSEFDCVHEQAVVHPMAVMLGAVLAFADRAVRRGTPVVSGTELVAATVLGVDVACHLGLASRSGLRFFRPGTAGAFAAAAAVGRLARLDQQQLVAAMGITLGQLCGTMQAHTEGSPVLAMQVGFNARNALLACDLALAGVDAPREVLEGPFGYFQLFEAEHDLAPVMAQVGSRWRIAEVAHKPYPCGRATHGVVEACLGLCAEHGFDAHEVEEVEARVPPLTHRLVGRRPTADMNVNYARLCAPFAAARAMMSRDLCLSDFEHAARTDAPTLALARRIRLVADDNPDPNALTPVTVQVRLAGGTRHTRSIETVYGNPASPMSRGAQLRKFHRCCAAGVRPLAADGCDAVADLVDGLEKLADVAELLEAVHAGGH